MWVSCPKAVIEPNYSREVRFIESASSLDGIAGYSNTHISEEETFRGSKNYVKRPRRVATRGMRLFGFVFVVELGP